MSKNKNKKKYKLNSFDNSINSNDPKYVPQLADMEFKEKIIIPYIMSNDTGGFRFFMIFMSVLFLVTDIVMFFVYGIKDSFIFTIGYLGFILFLILVIKFAPLLNVWRIRKQKIYYKIVDFCYFSSNHVHTTKYDYNVPAMVVYERFDYKDAQIINYGCSYKDSNSKLGNKSSRKLKKNDKVYKITNEKGKVLMLIGEGTGDFSKDKFSFNKVKLVLIKMLLFYIKTEIGVLLLQALLTLLFTLFSWIQRPDLMFKYFEWYCIFGSVDGFLEFMIFGSILPFLLTLFYPLFNIRDLK